MLPSLFFLTELLRKDSFIWNEKAQQSLDKLKLAMTKAPGLSLPDFQKQFVVQTDAFGTGMGAVLMQDKHPICYLSKKIQS